jgi:hypothetical protein
MKNMTQPTISTMLILPIASDTKGWNSTDNRTQGASSLYEYKIRGNERVVLANRRFCTEE